MRAAIAIEAETFRGVSRSAAGRPKIEAKRDCLTETANRA